MHSKLFERPGFDLTGEDAALTNNQGQFDRQH